MSISEILGVTIPYLGSGLIIIPSLFEYKDAIRKKRIEKQTDSKVSFTATRVKLICTVIGAGLLLYNNWTAQKQAAKNNHKAEMNEAKREQTQLMYTNLIANKIDTGRKLLTQNINGVITIQEATQTLINKVNSKLNQGLDSVIFITSQSEEERQITSYLKTLSAAYTLQDVISFFNEKHTSSALPSDSLEILQTMLLLDKKFKSVYPNYLFRIDSRIDMLWKECLAHLNESILLIRSGLSDLPATNYLPQRPGFSMEKIDAIYTYQQQISSRLFNIKNYIEERLKKGKSIGNIRNRYDIEAPEYVPENSINK